MNFELTADQALLLQSFESFLERGSVPSGAHGYVAYSSALQDELGESGFLDVAAQEGFGPLEAAILAERAARSAVSFEFAASALLGPLLAPRGAAGAPTALLWSRTAPARFLSHAKTACLFDGADVLVAAVAPSQVEPADSVAAYPMGRLKTVPKDARRIAGAEADALRRRALVAVAAEAAGLMRGALDQTIDYVKERTQFGQPLARFQAIQHRLAEDATLIRAARLLALRAAFTDLEDDAATACFYAQQTMRKVIHDCHQFSGAMGLTLEYPLHLWTYRLKVLQGEAGGRAEQARRAAAAVWPRRDAESWRRRAEAV